MKIGDKVKIRKDSDFFNDVISGFGQFSGTQGEQGIGVIEKIDGMGWFKVVFSNGYGNSYMKKDLQLVNSWKERYSI